MDKYSVISLVGEGSFGRVYKASRKSDNEIVAIKIITKRGRFNKELKTLRRECDIQAKLKHPNIIEMLESFETKNEIYVVTEYAQTDLHRFLLKSGTIEETKVQILAGHLVSALYYLHSHRILHRDLKPQNVLLNDNLHAKLCDFGLARNMTIGTHVLTSIKGTPLYMAPELLAEKPYDHQADLWSLGCILYETLCGYTPFSAVTILHLLRLLRNEEIKWPSFLSSDCISFLQGLLEKDASLRMTWTQLLCHPFIEGRLKIIDEDKQQEISTQTSESSPGINKRKPVNNDAANTSSKDNGEHSSKNTSTSSEQKHQESIVKISEALNSMNFDNGDNITSSRDSINAMLQSDVENIETDAEELTKINVPFVDTPSNNYELFKQQNDTTATPVMENKSSCYVSGNSNLIVNHFNDNFCNPITESTPVETKSKSKLHLNLKKPVLNISSVEKSGNNARSKDLEKRKLSQNLDNFSLRLGQSLDGENTNKKIGTDNTLEKKKQTNVKSSTMDEKSTENTPPCLLPGWDSCDESQSPPIENDEWLAFLHRSMQEILDGELDSLTQQNLVSIIVAPLRNSKASPKVIESVAQLLSLPLVLGGPVSTIECIKNVYIEVKLVPNLVYASKLLTSVKSPMESTSSSLPAITSQSNKFRSISELTAEEIKTISSLYELVCHLVHQNERFLSQFCDAVAILAADMMLINYLSHNFSNQHAIRISNCVIALLCCVIRELPENAELVEQIVFNDRLDLITLMKNKNALLRSRICMLFRLLGRFSCRGLQNIWSQNIREAIEALKYDSNEHVRIEADSALDELKQFSFYN